jgi:TfoX/Sxy family transcriptional regulator of competence genes
MAYNKHLAERIRERLQYLPDVYEKEMMGGLVFMVNDKMCVGIIKDELMCRIDRSMHETLVEMNGCRTMEFTKKPMIGYVLVEESAMRSDYEFNYWIELCLEFNPMAKASKKRSAKKDKHV